MKTFKTILLTLLISSSSVFAHGENKPGPHGGEIKMPGPFHTEVVGLGPKKVSVYLLDMSFNSPTIVDSSVSMEFEGVKKSKGTCQKEGNHFTCTFETDVANTEGQLHVKAIRDNKKGGLASYKTPLKFILEVPH